jgi:hypothetical protein
LSEKNEHFHIEYIFLLLFVLFVVGEQAVTFFFIIFEFFVVITHRDMEIRVRLNRMKRIFTFLGYTAF